MSAAQTQGSQISILPLLQPANLSDKILYDEQELANALNDLLISGSGKQEVLVSDINVTMTVAKRMECIDVDVTTSGFKEAMTGEASTDTDSVKKQKRVAHILKVSNDMAATSANQNLTAAQKSSNNEAAFAELIGAYGFKAPNDLGMTLIASGTCVLDAIFYMSLPTNLQERCNVLYVESADMRANMKQAEKSVAFMMLYALITGTWQEGPVENGRLPKIFKSEGFEATANMNDNNERLFCSFDINKIPLRILTFANYSKMSEKWVQRLELGVAGMRDAKALNTMPMAPKIFKELEQQYMFIRALAAAPTSFDHATATRSSASTTNMHSIRKSVQNMILLCQTQADIAKAIKDKAIFSASPFPFLFNSSTDYLGNGYRGTIKIDKQIISGKPYEKDPADYKGKVIDWIPDNCAALVYHTEYNFVPPPGWTSFEHGKDGKLLKKTRDDVRRWMIKNSIDQKSYDQVASGQATTPQGPVPAQVGTISDNLPHFVGDWKVGTTALEVTLSDVSRRLYQEMTQKNVDSVILVGSGLDRSIYLPKANFEIKKDGVANRVPCIVFNPVEDEDYTEEVNEFVEKMYKEGIRCVILDEEEEGSSVSIH